ncbi:ABC-three component system protein [Gluconobacter sp.]|uniref:ABC-three component system protein n=1 Tax=Gluconobacter sp. TaxID=1876758 RepID=UPI0039EB3F6A
MGTNYQYKRQILALDDDQLEEFVRQWALKKTEYVEVERFTGTGDMGRDVVGFLSAQRHEGAWHNYQCKQYGRTLPTHTGISELGKVLYYSFAGQFTAPEKFFFVAPRGINRNLQSLIFKPATFKKTMIDEWEKYCANDIVENKHIPLNHDLKAHVDGWDFSRISSISVDIILTDVAAKPVLYEWFGADPGPAPVGMPPPDVQPTELTYIQGLLDAYGEREGITFADHTAADVHEVYGPHLRMQRERYFDADAFTRFYRDNTTTKNTDDLRKEILHGIYETHAAKHDDILSRINAVMIQAGNTQPAGALAKYARTPVKQGICHHFVNEGQLKWKL